MTEYIKATFARCKKEGRVDTSQLPPSRRAALGRACGQVQQITDMMTAGVSHICDGRIPQG